MAATPPTSTYTNDSWTTLHDDPHDDAVAILATPDNSAAGTLRRAEWVNEAYMVTPRNAYTTPSSGYDSTNYPYLYRNVWENSHAIIYMPIVKTGTTPDVVVSIRGTDEFYDLVKDIEIFANYATNQYLQSLLQPMYQEAELIAQKIRLWTSSGQTWEMNSHSLGCKYSLMIWHLMYTNSTYTATLSQMQRNTCFNPYILNDSAYTALKNSEVEQRNKWHFEIVTGDFASVLVKTDPPIGSTVTIYDYLGFAHTNAGGDNLFETVKTLSQYLTVYGTINPESGGAPISPSWAYWNTVGPHKLTSFSGSLPHGYTDPLALDVKGTTIKTLQTQDLASLSAYGVGDQPLYLTADLTTDMHNALDDTLQEEPFKAYITVEDLTSYHVQVPAVLGTPGKVTFPIRLEFKDTTDTVVSSHVVRYLTHGQDQITGEQLLTFTTVDGQSVYRPQLENIIKLPTPLTVVPIGQYSTDFDNGDGSKYNFGIDHVQNDSWHSNRRSSAPELTIGFTFNSVISPYDTYDIEFALYDTGGGFLKWGHIDVGDYNNYKLQLPHKTGDEYYVHSNSYNASTAMYTPTYEIVYYDTTRYMIKATDVLNNGKYLKTPTPSQNFLTNVTNVLQYRSNASNSASLVAAYFMDMEWETWDGLTGSPDDYLFHIKPFAQTSIPRVLGNTLTNYDADGNMMDNNLFYPQYMQSANKEYTLTFQRDGNLVLYKDDGSVMYSSVTYYAGNGLYFQIDGNVVIYDGGSRPDETGSVRWASHTGGHHTLPAGYKIIFSLTNAGKLVITDDQDNDLWST